jgi:ABC-type amino acid transport substrate-binding protein
MDGGDGTTATYRCAGGNMAQFLRRSERHRVASRKRRGAALLIGLVTLAAACSVKVNASGDFTPKTKNTLTVATSEIPQPGFWEGTPEHLTGGFEYELARKLAGRFNLDHVKVVVVPFADLVRGNLGGADLALADITATDARREVLDFSGPYLHATPSVLVKSGTDVPDLQTAQSLTWAVGKSTTLRDYLHDTIRPDHDPLLTSTRKETTDAITSGRVDAGLLDLPVASAFASQSGGQLSVAGQFDFNDDVSAALPNGSDNSDAVSSAIRAFIADGTIKKLAQRWLGLDLNDQVAEDVPLIRTNS